MTEKVDFPAFPALKRQGAFGVHRPWVWGARSPGSGEDGESQVRAFGDENYGVEDHLLYPKSPLQRIGVGLEMQKLG